MVLQNEYGLAIGILKFENSNYTKGYIRMEDIIFTFHHQNSQHALWVIYSAGEPALTVQCGVEGVNNNAMDAAVLNSLVIESISSSFLLLTLCWYLYCSGFAKAVKQYTF